MMQYITKFRECTLDMEDAGNSLDSLTLKSMLLSRIHDKEFHPLRDTCAGESGMDIHDTIQKFREKFIRDHPNGLPKGGRRNTNNSSQQNSGNGNRNNNNNNNNNNSKRLPKEVWAKMSWDQKKEHWRNQHEGNWTAKTAKKGKDTKPGKTTPASNYQRQAKQLISLLQSLATDDPDTTAETRTANNATTTSDTVETPTLRAILKSQLSTANNARIVYVHQNYNKVTSEWAIVDSGADTCLLGDCFHITKRDTNQIVEVHGFNDKLGAETGLYIGTGLCAVDLPGADTLLLQVNEGVIMPKGKSLLAANQMRAHHTIVNDVPVRYGGKQSLITREDDAIPLQYLRGLVGLTIRKPTDEEIRDITPVELTSSANWHPDSDSDFDTERSLHYDNDIDVDNDGGFGQMYKAQKYENYDWDKLRKCFAWKPEELIKLALENTT